jgi:hypothetical protein
LSPIGFTAGTGHTGPIIEAYTFIATHNISALTFTSTSDYRVKKNINPLLLEDYSVDNLNPVYFKFKKENKESIGLIAHEVQEYYPFLVEGEKDGDKTQSVNYIGLIGVLIKEIQVLKGETKELKREMKELKQQII